ncbi:MAG: hypothetical protein NZ828_10540 [Alphaproteobacteria bacterium]|nr:hypothetical protein [Alphaproteobacteria bacterium]
MSDANIVNLCEAFIDAIDNDDLKIVEASLTVEESHMLASEAAMATAGGRFYGVIGMAEVFASVAYRIAHENVAASSLDLAFIDEDTVRELQSYSAPYMAKLVELARA